VKTISEKLREAMRDSGQSMYQIAKEAGVDYSIVNRFFNEQRDMKLATADRLAAYFGLELTSSRPARKK
jgi:transcriptional regulator with XRE-family HTH domain